SLAQGLAGIALHAGALRQAEPALTEAAGRHLATIGRVRARRLGRRAGPPPRRGPALTEPAGRHLDTIVRLVQSSLAEARASVWDLQPELLRDGDLPAALASMVRELTEEPTGRPAPGAR